MIKAGVGSNIREGTDITPLMRAVIEDHTQFVNKLIQAGADVNLTDCRGRNALCFVASDSHYETIDTLLKARANVNNVIREGNTPLLSAVGLKHNGDQDCKKEHNSYVKTVKILIEAGTDVNIQNNDGETALYCVSYYGRAKCVTSLLQAGADVNETGTSPLMMASQCGRLKCVNKLLKAGADVNQTNDDGHTALMMASRDYHHKCVDVLLNAGARVNTVDNDGCSVLHTESVSHYFYMPVADYVKCVKKLLRSGIHVNHFSHRPEDPPRTNALTRILARNEPSEHKDAVTLQERH